MNYIGLMSGTSMDAVDTVLVRFDANSLQQLAYRQYPIPGDLRDAVRKLNADSGIGELTRLDHDLGILFADAVLDLLRLAKLSPATVAAIGSHGQTVLHLPDSDRPRTLQIGDANLIAYRTGITTVADFRRMDMAAGGEGAPLAPAFHDRYFRSLVDDRVILNLGGIANITILPADPAHAAHGFDTGPGNGLLDDWIRLHRGTPMDRDGSWAAQGTVDHQFVECLLGDHYFGRPPPKSTGRDYFNLGWLTHRISKRGQGIDPVDVQASLVEFGARSISAAILQHAGNRPEVFVCGGGIHNPVLLRRLRDLLPAIPVGSTADIGIDPDAVEACTFAWLARQRLERHSGNLPSVTGAARPVILGSVYRGS